MKLKDFFRRWFSQYKFEILLVVCGLLVRILVCVIVQPGFDEAYYGIFSLNLAWGYFDHPPAVAIVAGMGRWLTGSFSPLSLRFGPIILFLFSCSLFYCITKNLFGEFAAKINLVLIHVTPYFLFGMGAFVFPDNALGFFWLLFLFSLIKIKQSNNTRWFILTGVSLGFALLSKYHGILLLVALFINLIIFKEWRRYLKSPFLYGGLLISVLIFLPNVYWNSQNNWISYLLQFGKSTSGGIKISLNLFSQAVLGQAGYLLPWTMFICIYAVILFLKKDDRQNRWLLTFAILPILIFTLIGATRQILPHWPMPGYIAAVILTSGQMACWKPRRNMRLLLASGITTLVAVLIIVIQSLFGIIPVDRKADLTLDGQGWRTVVEKLESEGYLDGESIFLFSHKWFTGGELAYASHDKYIATVLNMDAPHGFAFWTDPEEIVGKDGIFITTERYETDPEKLYGSYFQSYTRLDNITTYRCGREAQTFYFWICHNFQNNFPFPYGSR